MKNVYKRLLSLLLCLCMVAAYLPAGALQAFAAVDTGSGRVTDPNTMNQWQDYFGPNVLSTEFAGGVWTDKSVLTSASDFMADITMDDANRNFLIALSALAANQQIVGYESAPVDVMLVLDVSGSMQGSAATMMVQAANETIERFMSDNPNNRIGLVLYSGNANTSSNAGTNTASVILPLDHYTTTSTQTVGTGRNQKTIPAYLSISNNQVSVARNVKNSAGRTVTGSKSVSGGTYIQNGIYKAWGEFSNVTDVKVPAGQPQAGAQRTPVMILFSDGQPTLGTSNYNQIGTSQSAYGDGQTSSTTWRTVFLTQLTAAWAKGKMTAKYGTTAKFYTVGLGTGSSDYATAVLNPSGATSTTLNGYWNNFFNSNNLNNSGYVRVANNWSLYKDASVASKNYVDDYELASNIDDLLDAFGKIVDAIELDAAGHVTLVDESGENLSGYVTFTDEIGIFMEVKDLKGLVLGNTLFSGNAIAKAIQDGKLGTVDAPTELGHAFISTVRERLHIEDVTVAQGLVSAAYADGQLAYDARTGSYSNYIGWYSDDNGTYLAFWDKDTGITADGGPAGATWINKSYGYLGVAGSSDMMHVVVMLSTHIESGMQVMQYKIPASLLPKVTYEVELNSSDLTDMNSITRKEAFPLRLVYEVGLRDDINSINVVQKVNDAINAGYGHSHINADGSYSFYTNKWGHEHEGDEVDYNDPLNHDVAQSHFHPAEGNDRYYYTEDTPVYTKSGSNYVLYTGTAAPHGSGYYRAHHYYTAAGYTTEYLPMSEYALEQAAAHGRHDDGNWYIPEGAIFQQIDRFHMLKGGDSNNDGKADQNLTGTLEYYDYPVVVKVDDKYDTYAFLGNNGRITIVPAQGIKLTKTVTEAVSGASDTFTFDITLSSAVANPDVTDENGNALTGWSVRGNVITVSLKAGQSVYVTGIPTGVSYTVTERKHADYIGSSANAMGTVTANTVSPVDFVNVPRGYGNLIISKDVDHPFTNAPAAMTGKEFTINVTLSGEDVANKQFAVSGGNSQYITTDANGRFSVKLKDNGSLTVIGLPEGTTFVTTETLDPTEHKGFTMDARRSSLSGTIVKDTTVQSHVVNVYEPTASNASVKVEGDKILTDAAGAFDWTGKSFTIRLEKYDPATGTYTKVDEKQVTKGALRYAFTLSQFDTLGTYYYKVSEVIPENRLEGMSYDASAGRFEVRVTDNDVDGVMEIAVYDFDTNTELTAVNNEYTYEKDFENIHYTESTFVEFTVNKDVVDPHNTGVSESGFLFELFPVVNGVTSANAAYSMRSVMVSGQGQATFHIPVHEVGTMTFVLKEIVPPAIDRIPGMIYDTKAYTVTVTTVSVGGKLSASVSVKLNGNDVALNDVTFTNTVDLEPVVLKPYVTKILAGRSPMPHDSFAFHLEQTNGSFVPRTVTNPYSDDVTVTYNDLLNNGGKAYFDEIEITQVGTYYYRVTEATGNAGGMTYDNSIYHITVNVTASGNQLVKNVSIVKVGDGASSSEMDSVQFTNTYKNTDSEQVTLRGSKKLTGRALITGEFRFRLMEGRTVLQTVTNRADGSFVFAPITYTAEDAGTHTYTITEVDDGKGGISYDGRVYTVTVNVTDNGRGELVVTTTGADAISFENTYATDPVDVSVSGTKVWYNADLDQNRILTGGEFTFALYETDETFTDQGAQVKTAVNDANGDFILRVNYTKAGHYYYLLRELSGDAVSTHYDGSIYRVHIAVYDNGLGQLVGAVESISKVGTGDATVAFENIYNPAGTELVISGNKELIGHPITDGEFGFQLFAADAQFNATGDALQTVYNHANDFAFESIAFTKSGTYHYVVKEIIPAPAVNNVYNGITYDTTAFGITVTVEDVNGQLQATYTVSANGTAAQLKFVNEYNLAHAVDIEISGSKTLNGETDFGGRTFEFVLLDENNVQIGRVSPDASGAFAFHNIAVPTALNQKVTHTFYVKELNNALGGIRYDERVYTVTVSVEDLGNGQVDTQIQYSIGTHSYSQIKFENQYELEPLNVQIYVDKVLENKELEAEMFLFELLDDQNNVIRTTTNGKAGSVLFDAIEYANPGTYVYTVREVVPAGGVKDGITYDTHTVQVTVTVTDNGDGTMSAQISYDGNHQFTNVYNVTGDPMFSITGQKELTGRDIADGEFTFILANVATGGKTEAVNVGTSFSFENVGLDGVGIHHFTVTEKNAGKGGVSYDERTYDISVTVIDDGKGGMIVEAPEVTHHGVATHLVFSNVYNRENAKVTFSGIKELVGGDLSENQFKFDLFETDSSFEMQGLTPIAQAANAADGSFSFDASSIPALNYSAEDVHYYVIVENTDDAANGIVYDGIAYRIKVTVTDDLEGSLVAKTECLDGSMDDIRFVNADQGEIFKKDVFSEEKPNISIDGQSVNLGDVLVYSITYTNSTSAGVKVTVTDQLSDGLAYVAGSADNGGVFADGAITWNLELEAGQTKTVTFKAEVTKVVERIDNQATGFDGITQITTNTTTVTVKEPEPEVTEPETTEPEATEPEVTEPEATEPEVTEPEATEPEVTEPEVTEPEVTEPEDSDPDRVPETGDTTDIAMVTGMLGFSMVAIVVLFAVLLLDRKNKLIEE